MKVLLVSLRSDVGGGPEHVAVLAKGLVDRGFDVLVAAPTGGYSKEFEDRTQRPTFAMRHRTFGLSELRSLRILICSESFDVVHSHGRGAGVLLRLLRISVPFNLVHTFHGLHHGSGLRRAASLALERLFKLIPCHQIFVSRSEFQEATSDKLLRERNYSVVENGIELREGSDWRHRTIREPVIAHVSRFNYHKNTDEALAVFDEYRHFAPAARLVVFGEPDESTLEEWQRERYVPDAVEFFGNVADLRSALIQENVSCVISSSRWEGLPLSLIEAMSVGVPVVASNVVGNSDVIDGAGGALYQLGDIHAGSIALKSILDPENHRMHSEAAVKKATARWSAQRMVDETVCAYTSVVDSPVKWGI